MSSPFRVFRTASPIGPGKVSPGPRNPDSRNMWRDGKGDRVDPERAGQMLRIAGGAASELAG